MQLDYYQILGIQSNASDDVIKKACNDMRRIHSPDRNRNKSQQLQAESEYMIRLLNESCSTLRDPDKKKMYDDELQKKSLNKIIIFGEIHDEPQKSLRIIATLYDKYKQDITFFHEMSILQSIIYSGKKIEILPLEPNIKHILSESEKINGKLTDDSIVVENFPSILSNIVYFLSGLGELDIDQISLSYRDIIRSLDDKELDNTDLLNDIKKIKIKFKKLYADLITIIESDVLSNLDDSIENFMLDEFCPFIKIYGNYFDPNNNNIYDIWYKKYTDREPDMVQYLQRLRDNIMVDTIKKYSQTVNNKITLCIIVGKDHVDNIISLLNQNGYNQISKIDYKSNSQENEGKKKYYHNKYNKYKNKYLRLKNNYKL